jgi:putative ABC transport system ATP-binding protein
MNEIAVHAENLHKSYLLGATAVGALRGVDLTVRRGEFVAFMGPSGCGKTTLLNLIGAIDTPSRGRLYVDDVALERLSEDELADLRRDRIGVVFQFYNLLPTLSARENVELPMQFKGAERRQRRERALWLLERVGLKDRAEHKPAGASSRGFRSPARWPTSRRWCCWTNRPGTWTALRARRLWRCSGT